MNNKEKNILFPEGIPGFENLKKFNLIKVSQLFFYLQSVDQPEICFTIIDPSQLNFKYEPIIPESYFLKIGEGQDKDYAVFVIVSMKAEIAESTVNLAGPILIHTENRKGIQVVTENDQYTVRHKLKELLTKRG